MLGLKYGENLAIFLERLKSKGSFYIRAYTFKGIQTFLPEKVKKELPYLYTGKDNDNAAMRIYLDSVSKKEDVFSGEEKKKTASITTFTERIVWDAIRSEADGAKFFSLDELVVKLGYEPSAENREAVRAALARSGNGNGFFPMVDSSRGFLAISGEQYDKIKQEIVLLKKVFLKLFTVEMVPAGTRTEEFVSGTVTEGNIAFEERRVPADFNTVDFTPEERTVFESLLRKLEYFIEYDRWPKEMLAGTPVIAIDGFHYPSFLADNISEYTSCYVNHASAFALFLLKTGKKNINELLWLLTRRQKNLKAFEFNLNFPETVLKECEALPEPAEEMHRWTEQNRHDLTHLTTYTIDPPDAKDFDDAISFEIQHQDGASV
ncbi:MAG: hypothetical protein QW728_05825, partial [Thermoplasmata archaeon]